VNDIANVFLLVYAGLFPIVNPVGNSASIVPANVINGFPMSPVIVIAATSAPTSEADKLLCRTDAQSAQLLTSDIDERDRPFISGERTAEGFFRIRPGLGVEYAIARSLAYAPYADLLWWETSEPDLGEAERFADTIHREFPDKMLAYNCSPSFNWRKRLAPESPYGRCLVAGSRIRRSRSGPKREARKARPQERRYSTPVMPRERRLPA
jgi:hypothetical protein